MGGGADGEAGGGAGGDADAGGSSGGGADADVGGSAGAGAGLAQEVPSDASGAGQSAEDCAAAADAREALAAQQLALWLPASGTARSLRISGLRPASPLGPEEEPRSPLAGWAGDPETRFAMPHSGAGDDQPDQADGG